MAYNNEQNLTIEIHHGRKTTRTVKGVIQKVVISTLILTSVMGMSAIPSMAANIDEEAKTISQQYNVSIKDALVSIQNTIDSINAMKRNGTISNSTLNTLASQLQQLNTAIKANGATDLNSIEQTLKNVEKSVDGVDGNGLVLMGVDAVRETLGNSSSKQVVLTSSNINKAVNIKFSDVPSGQWYTTPINAMASMGIINGKGNNKFDPDGTMTRAEFICVIGRYLFKNQEVGPNNGNWYDGEVQRAIDNGLIKSNDFSNYNTNCSREEMSYILVNALSIMGESASKALKENVPDANRISAKYQDAALKAIGTGLIAGVDSQGTFNPSASMTRAQAATVIYRLIEPTQRVDSTWATQEKADEEEQAGPNVTGQVNEWGNVVLDTKPSPLGQVSKDRKNRNIDLGQKSGAYNWSTHQDFTRNNVKFREGEKHPVPVAGDIVVKADGTEVKVEYFYGDDGWFICLRAIGCDIWTGATYKASDGNYYTIGGNTGAGFFDNDMSGFDKGGSYCDEFYTDAMWTMLRTSVKRPSRTGKYDGEISENYFYRWDSGDAAWYWIGR